MKTNQIALIIAVAILAIAIFTNPSEEKHKEVVNSIMMSHYQQSLKENQSVSNNGFEALGNLLGSSLITTLVENGVKSDNYLLFSITKMTYDGQEKSIGFGAFGNVFLSDKVEDAFNRVK